MLLFIICARPVNIKPFGRVPQQRRQKGKRNRLGHREKEMREGLFYFLYQLFFFQANLTSALVLWEKVWTTKDLRAMGTGSKESEGGVLWELRRRP